MVSKLIGAFLFASLAHGIEVGVEVDSKGSKPLLRHESLMQEEGNSQADRDSLGYAVQYKYYKFSVERVRPGYGAHAFSQFALRDIAGNKIKLSDPSVAKVLISTKFGTAQDASVLLKDSGERSDVVVNDKHGGVSPCPLSTPLHSKDSDESSDVVVNDGDFLLIELMQKLPVTSFEFRTSAKKGPEMDPITFKLLGSQDQQKWIELTKYIDFATPYERGATVGPFIMSRSSTFMTVVQEGDGKEHGKERAKEELVKKAKPPSKAAEKPRPIIKTIYAPAEVKTVYVYRTKQEAAADVKPDPNAPPPCKD